MKSNAAATMFLMVFAKVTAIIFYGCRNAANNMVVAWSSQCGEYHYTTYTLVSPHYVTLALVGDHVRGRGHPLASIT